MRIIIIVLISLMYSNSFCQIRFDYPITEIEPAELIVTYSLEYTIDSLNPQYKNQADMYLFIGKSTSKFISKNLYRSDTIERKFKNIDDLQEHLLDQNAPFPRIPYQIFKNKPAEQMTIIEYIIGGTYKYQENLHLFNWQITGDADSIASYKVQKATCDFGGRSWEAWFTPEIPINDGPYKFNGLPGLILKVHDTRNHYTFEILSVEKPGYNLMIDRQEKNYIETTKQGFFKAKDNLRDDIVSRAKSAGLNNKTQQQAAKAMAERNNPLELLRK